MIAVSTTGASADVGHTSTIYTLSNEASGNRVLAFARSADGSLTPAGSYATGANGSGGGLGSQGSVVVSGDRQILLAVNAGSNSVSAFRVKRDGTLRLMSTAPSGGAKPISVTVHGEAVFVLNGDDNTISGLGLDDGLAPIPGSTRPLTGKGGAQVSFTPNGRQLVVTEKASDLIDTFSVGEDGRVGTATPAASTGQTPFGFSFDHNGHLLVSNAAGGAAGKSSLSSYSVGRTGVAAIDGPVASTQTAACWVALSEDGRFAYTTNTGSGTVTGYAVTPDGQLTLLNANGVTATVGSGPIDAAVVGGDLYTVDSKSRDIAIDHVGANGSLTPAGNLTGLPASAVGLAAA